METEEKFVCRLCLTRVEGDFKVVGESTQEMLNAVLLILDLKISDEPVLCNNCGDRLKKCFDFKINCLQREHQIFLPFKVEDDMKINKPTASLCYFCMKSVEDGQFAFLENKDLNMMVMLEQYFPEVVLNLTEDSITCIDCYESLQNHLTFISNCLSVEGQIQKYCETEGTNGKGQVELNSVLNFTSTIALENTNTNNVNTVKIEPCYEQTKSENSKVKLESDCIIDTEKQKLDLEEYSDMKLEEEYCDSVQVKVPASPPDENSELGYETSIQDQLVIHKNLSETTVHICQMCAFETKHKRSLRRHMLIHKRSSEEALHNCPSEVAVYKCQVCAFQTKHKDSLRKHMVIHKEPSEVTMFKCQLCAHQTKHKSNLRSHMLTHTEWSEIAVYKCLLCTYQAKHKRYLKSHMLVHEKPSEMATYECHLCAYKTKQKRYLQNHMLVHQKPSEITMYKCQLCPYQMKHKRYLHSHMLIHKAPSEVTIHKCQLCAFQTKRKESLRRHVLNHKEPSETTNI